MVPKKGKMGVTKKQRHSVFALKEAYETILMAPAETSRDKIRPMNLNCITHNCDCNIYIYMQILINQGIKLY